MACAYLALSRPNSLLQLELKRRALRRSMARAQTLQRAASIVRRRLDALG